MADIDSFLAENLNGHEELEVFGDDSSKIKNFAFLLDGELIDVVFSDFCEKQLLIITQYQKIGTLILVSKGSIHNLSGSEVYEVKTLSGVDNQDYHLAARYLAEQLCIKKPVLFGISLKNVSVKILKGITKALKENLNF